MRKEGSCLEKEIIQGTVPGGRGKGRPINSMDNIRKWTGRTQEDLIRMMEDRRRWRNIVRDPAYPRSEEGWEWEQNRTETCTEMHEWLTFACNVINWEILLHTLERYTSPIAISFAPCIPLLLSHEHRPRRLLAILSDSTISYKINSWRFISNLLIKAAID